MNRYMVSYELPPNSLGEKDPITMCIGQFLFTDIHMLASGLVNEEIDYNTS